MTVVRDTTTGHDVTTDANFRAWAQMVHNALVAVGMVETNDSGEIDLSTVAAPGTNTYAGYEVFRFNDADQGNNPIYFKFEYGKGGQTTRASWRITVGTGTDGAGTIANALTAQSSSATASPSGTPEFHCCHVDGCLAMVSIGIATSGITAHPTMFIERFRDENGAVISSGGNRGFSVASSAAMATRKGGSNTNSLFVASHGNGSAALPDGRKRLSPYIVGDNNPMIGLLMAKSGEITAGDSGVASVYGTSRTYRLLTAAAVSITGMTPFNGTTQNVTHAIINE